MNFRVEEHIIKELSIGETKPNKNIQNYITGGCAHKNDFNI